MLGLLLALAAAVIAQPADTSQCAKVSPVTRSTDIPALQADADCFGAAAAADDAGADALRKAQAQARASQKYRLDRIAALKAMHPPAAPGFLPSPTLAGLAGIATADFDPATAVVKMAVPGTMAPDVVGAFRFICGPGQVLADDPIMYPGQPGKSHLHQFYGLTSVDAYSTYATMRASKADSTCNSATDGKGGFKVLNRSGYWMPALLDGKGNVVRPDYVAIYYKRRPLNDPKCSLTSGDPQAEGNCLPIPNGLRFIFGRDMTNFAAPPTGNFHFLCQTPGGTPIGTNIGFKTMDEALAVCSPGNQFAAIVDAPACWDGKNLDSPNHRDHVGYPGYGNWGYLKCDAQHPYVIPTFTLGARWTIAAGDDTSKWSFSSDAMLPAGQPRGSSFHADYDEGWDPVAKQTWTDNCLNKFLSCTSGNLGNGTGLPGAAWGNHPADPRLVPIASVPKTPVR